MVQSIMMFARKTVFGWYWLVNRVVFLLNSVGVSHDFRINGYIRVQNHGSITIGKGFVANSGLMKNPIGGDGVLRLVTGRNATLEIGNFVGMSNCTINVSSKIHVGDHVVVGGGVKIWDSDFHSLNPLFRQRGGDRDIKVASISIADNCFIGGMSIILKGVQIGTNSVIAAGSVVTKSIPANVVAGGNPCRIIRHLNLADPKLEL